jgi:sec-independent protein translocase protein TatA
VIGDILQPTHLLFVLVIALIVLGPKRLPEVGRSLGRGLRDFRSAISGQDQDPPEEAVQGLPSGESELPPQEQAVTTATPAEEPTAAQAEQPTVVQAEEPTAVSAAHGAPPQEPASVSAEHGSTGST